jgi:hypothetical protein
MAATAAVGESVFSFLLTFIYFMTSSLAVIVV